MLTQYEINNITYHLNEDDSKIYDPERGWLTALLKEREELMAQVAELTAKLDAGKRQFEQMQAELAEAHGSREKIIAEARAVFDAEIAKLRKERDALQAQNVGEAKVLEQSARIMAAAETMKVERDQARQALAEMSTLRNMLARDYAVLAAQEHGK